MFEKVNPMHPDKLADRIAGAITDLAYRNQEAPRLSVEVLLGHHYCYIIAETSVEFEYRDVMRIVQRIAGPDFAVYFRQYPQDALLADNQKGKVRCGDNGIFKGMPTTQEQIELTATAKMIYGCYPSDGKYIQDGDNLIICQSNAKKKNLALLYPEATINPLGDWTGGTDCDCGATNRKLGSDMGDAVTGGGLHGKDLSKADVSVNIYAYLKAQNEKKPVELKCAIGDEYIDGKPYAEVVRIAHDYIKAIGGFEKFAEWGLIR